VIEIAPIIAVLLPLFGAFLIPIISMVSKRFHVERACSWFAVVILVTTLAVVAAMGAAVWGSGVMVYKLGGWSPPWGIVLAVDGLNLLIALIVAGVSSLVAIYSLVYMRQDTRIDLYSVLLLLVTAGAMGSTLTGDIFNLYVFFEIMSIGSYALVAFRRKWDSVEAGIKYMIIGSLGTSLILLGIALLYGMIGSLTIADLAQKLGQVAASDVLVPLALLITGFGIKIAMIPLHAWAPDAYQAAPSSISALLAGATTTAGLYAMIRVVYMMFGAFGVGTMFAVFGLVTMVVGALMALTQRDLKRLLAYSGISQMGYILFGIGLGTALGVQGGLFHLLNNAIFKALLFMCAGAILYRVGTTNLNELGGLGKNMPITAGLFVIGALAISGVPPLNGFASKWTIYIAGIEAGKAIFSLIAIIMSVLTLAYFLKAINSIFLGQRPKRLQNIKEAPLTMLFPMMLLAVLCIVLGVLPSLGINLVAPAQGALMNQSSYINAVLGGI